MVDEVSKPEQVIELLYDIDECKYAEEKIELINEFSHQKLIKRILMFCYSPTIYFGFFEEDFNFEVNFLTRIRGREGIEESNERLRQVIKTLNFRSKNKISKSEALSVFKEILNECTRDEFELYKRISLKNIGIGLSSFYIEKHFPELITYPAYFMYAGDYSSELEIDFPVYSEPLIAGVRVKICAYPDGHTMTYSEENKIINDVFDSYAKLLRKFSKKLNKKLEVDLIVTQRQDENSVVSLLKLNESDPINPNQAEDIKNRLYVYLIDFLVYSKNSSTVCRKPLYKRKKDILKFSTKVEGLLPKSVVVPFKEVSDHSEINSSFNKAISNDYLGIILKDKEGPYVPGRDCFWLTVSNSNKLMGRVVDFVQNPNREMCSKLIVKLRGEERSVSIPSDDVKYHLWLKKDSILDRKAILFESNNGEIQFVKLRR